MGPHDAGSEDRNRGNGTSPSTPLIPNHGRKTMLILSRYLPETIVITAPNGDKIEVSISEVRKSHKGPKVKLAFEAPKSYRIYRTEVLDKEITPCNTEAKAKPNTTPAAARSVPAFTTAKSSTAVRTETCQPGKTS